MTTANDRDRANLDPASVFAAPSDVVRAPDLSHEDKKSILIKWEADADALLRATDEGMEPTPGHRSPAEILRAVHAAMQQLDCIQLSAQSLPSVASAATRKDDNHAPSGHNHRSPPRHRP